MFTGVVKLAQIDDYISPGQSCVQPKILKPNPKHTQTATVSLNDCLACSGCITSAESILIEQMSIKKFLQMADRKQPVYFIVSPQALVSLAKYYCLQVSTLVQRLGWLMSKHYPNVQHMYQLTLATQLCHQLVYHQFLQRANDKKTPILCSQCPGWVCYAQKTLPDAVIQHMSCVKSPQQLMAQMIKYKYGQECRVVTLMPCYDKKLEAIRFEIEDKVKEVDLTLATIEMVELVKQTCGEEMFRGEQGNAKSMQEQNQSTALYMLDRQIETMPNELSFLNDQTSNGYLESLLHKLGVTQYTTNQLKNSDFKQYTFTWQGTQHRMAKCYGFRNIQKVVQLIKKNKCPYIYIEIMACPGGCFGGGGQVRFEGLKGKDIVGEFQQMVAKCSKPAQLGEVELGDYGLRADRVQAKYRAIEKSLNEAVMNW